MPKAHYEPKKLVEVDGVTVWHTYEAGCGAESDKQLGYHYTLDDEQAEVDMGTSHHFDVRELPMYSQIPSALEGPVDGDFRRGWEAGHHAAVILPLGEEFCP